MAGTKIMVFQLKELIRTAIFALIGLALIIMLIIFLIPKDKKSEATNTTYVPGTYSSQIILHSKPVDVEVTVSGKEIIGIQLKNLKAEQEAFYPLFKPTLDDLAEQIIKYQTTKISTPTETNYTSKILLEAVDTALSQATSAE